jgi:TetR/AcrR family transcriptional repressor of nem operon
MKSADQMKTCRGVGRPREFDTSEMLEVVTKAFWDEGYAATSLSDLMDVTGLKKGSLYAAYGDKHTLFLKCLKNYLGNQRCHMEAHFAARGEPIDKLRQWLAEATCSKACKAAEPSSPCGCFAINSMVELGPHDTDVKALLDQHFQSVEDLLTSAIEEGQKSSKLRPGPARVQARLLLSVVAGAAVRARSGEPDEVERQLQSYLLELLG